MNKFEIDILNNLSQTEYSTYRCLTGDIGKYALLGNIKHKIEGNLNIYPIVSVFKASISSGGTYDEGVYSIRIWLENDVVKVKLICLKHSELLDICLDEKVNEINIFGKTSVAGGTITVNEIVKTGFIYWKNFSKFTMTEYSFTNKITTKYNNQVYKTSVEIDSENVGRSYSIKRTINGVIHKLLTFIDNNGKVIFGKHNNNEEYGDYITSLEFDNKDIGIQLQAGGRIYPTRNNSNHIGSADNKFRTLHLNDGVICSRTSIPTELYNGLSFFHAPSKNWVTYFNGKWYSNGNEINIS